MSNRNKKLKYCRPDWYGEYRNSDCNPNVWNAKVTIRQELSINNPIAHSPCNLPTLYLKFHLDTLFTGQQERVQSRSLNIKLFHSATYMSREKFYRVIEDNIYEKWGEMFDKNDRQDFIDNIFEEIHEIIGEKFNKGRQRLVVSIRTNLFVSDIMKLVWKMKTDENLMNDDCIICFQEFEKGRVREVLCMPCSHVFHADCIAMWLQNGHCCPVCRYDFRE